MFRRSRGSEEAVGVDERYYYASQSQLIWQKFRRHRLAVIGGSVLLLLYLLAIFCDFVSPYSVTQRFSDTVYRAPSRIHVMHEGRLQLPFVYGTSSTRDPETFELIFVEEKSERYPIRLFVRSDHRYRFLGLIPTTIKLFGVEAPGAIHLFGTDSIGRDLFTRTLCGARLSLSIGLVGVFISFLIGIVLGGISGYFGGVADMIIQRAIEFLIAIPTIPLWLALSASLPRDWPVVRVYFGIVIILSLISWGGLARVVRGKLLELREQDYAMAAKVTGMSDFAIIWKHLLPNFASYLIVYVTLAVPDVILGETALSFLGLGLRSPAVSWGVLLQKAQNIRSIAIFPWMLIPALFVVITVLAFNFLGDGLRDAADPYKD